MINESFLKKSISEAMNQELMLNGIQIEVYRKNINDDWKCDIDTQQHDERITEVAISEFVKSYKDFMNAESADAECKYESCVGSPTGWCIDCFAEKWLENQNSIIKTLKPRGCADMPKEIICNCTKEQK